MKPIEVFTPGRHPTHTFVRDHLEEKKQQLLQTLDAGSMLISISGPSKCGKTVFIEDTLGKGNIVHVTGANVHAPEDLWMKVFDISGAPVERVTSTTKGYRGSATVAVKAEAGIVVAKKSGEVNVTGGMESSTTNQEKEAVDSLQLLIKEFGETDMVIFIDDFHYIHRDVQAKLAAQIKDAISKGVKIVVASVPYHSDDVLRGNPDLRGRLYSIDFDYWVGDTLKKIAYKGFSELGVQYREPMINRLASEAAGSPQLMQYLCLSTCNEIGVLESTRGGTDLLDDEELLKRICLRTVPATDYSSTVERMKEGPRQRGSDRKMFITNNDWQGDVYRLLLLALAQSPPFLTFRYQELQSRIASTTKSDSPSGSSVTSACSHVAKIANESAGASVVEWDGENDVFDIRDPYLLFYLRWCGTLET